MSSSRSCAAGPPSTATRTRRSRSSSRSPKANRAPSSTSSFASGSSTPPSRGTGSDDFRSAAAGRTPSPMATISPDAIATTSFDHVALWVSDRGPLTELLCERLGLHVIDSTDDFTLVGADAREGKLTLFEAEGERDPGLIERVILRVNDLDDAVSRLGDEFAVEHDGSTATFEGPQGL